MKKKSIISGISLKPTSLTQNRGGSKRRESLERETGNMNIGAEVVVAVAGLKSVSFFILPSKIIHQETLGAYQ
jgi:hypothetical protein